MSEQRETPSREKAVRNTILSLFFLLFTVLSIRFCLDLPEDYNEAVSRLELSGQEAFPWPDHPFVADEYLRPLQQAGSFQELVQVVVFSDTHPPLYPIALWSWAKLHGSSLISLRLFSVLCFFLSGIALFSALRGLPLFPRLGVLILTLLCLSSGGEIFRARNYALALLFTQLAFWAANRNKSLGPLGVFSGLAFSTHYLSLLGTLPLLMTSLWKERRSITLRSLLLFGLLFLLTAAPGILALSVQLGARGEQFSGFPGMEREILAALLSCGEFLFAHGILPSGALLGVLSLGGFLLCVLFSRSDLRGGENDEVSRLIRMSLFGIVFYGVGLLSLDWMFDKAILSQGPSRYWTFLGAFPWLLAVLSFSRWPRIAVGVGLALFGLLLPLRSMRPSPFLSVLADSCQEKDLIILGAGYGRGHPGKWISQLSSAGCRAPLFVLNEQNEDRLTLYLRDRKRTVFLPSGEKPGHALELRWSSSPLLENAEDFYREVLARKAKEPLAVASPSPNGS